jgi:hypothetical protein
LTTVATLEIRPGGDHPTPANPGENHPPQVTSQPGSSGASSSPDSARVALDVITDKRLTATAALLGGLVVGGMPPQEARQLLHLSKATFYRSMSQLEVAGWVSR